MFHGLENTQKDVAQQLETLISENNFPSSVIFYGPQCSSRMFAALAVAKAFGSDTDSTVIVSDRNYSIRIAAALKLFRKSKNLASKKYLKYEVSTFLKQYHGALMESQASSSKKKFSEAGECSGLLDELDSVSDEKCDSFADKLEKSLNSLVDLAQSPSANKGAVSVGQIRAIRQWASESSVDGKKKIVIIEDIENASESASNALLKTLEEPPADTHFILISENIGRIPATILSRVRRFRFNPLGKSEVDFVLRSLFVSGDGINSIQQFFYAYSGVNDVLLGKSAEALVSNLEFDLPALVAELEKSQAWDRFFEILIDSVKKAYFSGLINEKYCEYLVAEIENAVSKGKAFNQTRRLTFDFVFGKVKEVIG